jgi:hypothetical protein
MAYETLTDKRVEPNATRDVPFKKINNLRNTLRSDLKKVIQSKRSGTREDEAYIPTLWYYGML